MAAEEAEPAKGIDGTVNHTLTLPLLSASSTPTLPTGMLVPDKDRLRCINQRK